MMASDASPAIFYVPHPDDEAIGMVGSIQKYKEMGRKVYMVLLTDAVNDKVLGILNGQIYCKQHETFHDFGLTMEQLVWARKVEFIASVQILGVDKLFMIGDGRGFSDVEPLGSARHDEFASQVANTIEFFEHSNPGASHHLTSGHQDTYKTSNSPVGDQAHPTHKACWQAANELRGHISDFHFHRIYTYLKPKYERVSPIQLKLTATWQSVKQTALNQYKLFMPRAFRYAIGYHSVPTLIDAAFHAEYEYIDT